MEIIFNFQNAFFKKDQKTFIYTDEKGNQQELSIYILNRVLSLIANRYLYNKQEHSEYTQIHSSILSQIDQNYRSYIKWLKRNDIIIVDESYELKDEEKGKEGKTKQYAFTDEFKNWGVVTSMEKDKFDENTNKDQSYLIFIDKRVLRNIMRDFKAIQINDDTPIIKEYKIDTDEMRIIDFKSYLSSEFNFWRMKNNDTYYNWKSGRLYTNFCQCSKSTRLNNFYFEDKLATLDIPSSFPLWLAVWLKNHGMDTESYEYRELCTIVKPRIDREGNFYKNENGEIKTHFYSDLRSKMDNNRNLILSQVEEKPITKCQRVDEKETAWDRDGLPIKYEKKKCNQKLEEGGWCPIHGVIIEDDSTNRNHYEKPHISRDRAKEDFQSWLNGDNGRTTLINYIFKSYYGDIQSIVDKHKNGDKKFMYYELVKMETNFIFNIICGRLYAEIPDIRILSCHDQIYFEQQFYDQVEKIWIEELRKVYDSLPSHVDVEYDYSEMGLFEG